MVFHRCNVLARAGRTALLVVVLALSAFASTAKADTLASGYTEQPLIINPDGQFTANNGSIYFWNSNVGYQVYNTSAGTTSVPVYPAAGTVTNGAGDAFGVYDSTNGAFYAGTVAGSGPTLTSSLYAYNGSAWSNSSTSAGVSLPGGAAAYGAQAYNGELFVSGGTAAGYSTATNLVGFGPNGINSQPQILGQLPGYAAYLAVDPRNGALYYATSTSNEDDTLYRWSGSQVSSAGTGGISLSTSNATQTWTLPGNGNGLAVDSAGNVFFSVNDWTTGVSTLGMIPSSLPNSYEPIDTTTVGTYSDYGAISVDGNFLNGGTLYFQPNYGSPLAAIQAVPEPGSLALLAAAAAVALIVRRRRRA